MLKSANRFHGLGALNFVYRKGFVIKGQGVSLKYLINNRRVEFRTSIVVSKKVHKSAVKRNRIRRRIYAVVEKFSDQITKPYDLVIMLYSSEYFDMPSAKLEQNIKELLQRAEIIQQDTKSNL